MSKVSKEEENWRAEDDARTLIEYQKIYKDKQRLEEAKKKLKAKQSEIEKALGK